MLGKLNPWRRSLSNRLLLVFIAASILMTALVVVTVLHGFASAWRVNARPHLELYLDYIAEDIGSPPNEQSALALSRKLPINIYIQSSDSIYSTNSEPLDVSEMFFNKRGKEGRGKYRGRNGPFGNVEFGGDENRTMLKRTDGDYTIYYELTHQNKNSDKHSFLLPSLLALLGALGLLYFIIRRMLLPVKDIRLGVKEMGQGNLDHRIHIRRDNDLGTLAGSINTMASDIEKLLDSKRQLLLGASHELRTPLTRATVATQLLPESQLRQQIEEDLQEMKHLIADILESERMKSGHSVLDKKPIDLHSLVVSVLSEMKADDVGVQIPKDLPTLLADPVRLGILIRNLVGNAITHSAQTNESVLVIARHVNDHIELTVKDSGPGISAEHIDKLTEPFYRTDESRARQTGGFGLGLHLVKLITQAHGGSLDIHSRCQDDILSEQTDGFNNSSESGTSVSVKLPVG